MQTTDDTDARPGGPLATILLFVLAFLAGIAIAAAGVPLPF